MKSERRKSKRLVSLLLSAAMLFSVVPNALTLVSAAALPGLSDVSRMAAAEGVVLLENPAYGTGGEANEIDKVLPVKNGQTVSIFGVVQDYYYSNGTGSGGGVSGIAVDHITTIADGLRSNPNVKVNENLASIYKAWIKENPFIENGGWTDNTSWSQKEMPMTEEIVSDAKAQSDMAIVIIGRTAGEDHEAQNIKGSYLLTDTEKDMLDKVYAQFDRVAVVLNVGHIIDMKWAADYPNAAIVYAWQGGMEGGSATADVLTGDVTPSGKLNDTIAKNIEDYAADGNHTCDRWANLNYEEDIYVGYRYFETFAPEKVLYPFGYGISYTEFKTTTNDVTVADGSVTVNVMVENIGKMKGKEVVQVYYGAPQGLLGKPAKQLAAFAKTGVLQPGESQTMSISYKIDDMASYDDGGVTGNDSSYVLEAGDYKIYVGNDVRSCEQVKVYNEPETRVTDVLEEVMAPTRPLQRMKPGELKEDGTYELTYEDVPQRTVDYEQRIRDNFPAEIERTDKKEYRLIDVYNGTITMDQFIGQFSDNDLAAIVIGEENNDSDRGTTGAAGCFGSVTKSLEAMGIPLAIAADGPAGIRVNKSVTVSSIPNGTMLACTWNVDLVQKMYEYLGQEMVMNGVDTILGPGVDIHRYPLNGRNFEYFSEDPLVVGMMATASSRGIQSQGVTPTIKHFAANNLEKDRREYNSCVSERALREIYLRGFEIAVRSGNCRSIMTSYNAINGTWTSSSYDLNTIILRNEWGFDGIVMTDWWASLGEDQGFYDRASTGTNGKVMVRAQQDLYMRKNSGEAEKNLAGMNQLSEYQKGNLTLGELQRTAKNICNYLVKSPALARLEGITYEPSFTPGPDRFTVQKDVTPGDPMLSGIRIGGKSIRADVFNLLTLDYKAFYNGSGEYPTVDATAQEGTTIQIEQASDKKPAATIIAISGKEERVYKVIFTTEDGLEPLFENPTYAYLDDIQVNGSPLEEFDRTSFYYAAGVSTLNPLPEVTVSAPDGVTATVVPDPENNRVSVRCVSTDQANTYVLQFGKLPTSDQFDSTELNDVWYINTDTQNNGENKDNWSLEAAPGSLRIIAERGDFWQGDNNLKNFFQQDVYGNWEANVKVDLNEQPKDNFKSVGVVASQDNNNYIYLKYEQSNGSIMGMYKETKGQDPVPIGKISGSQITDLLGSGTTVYFRLKKIGNTYSGYASADGENYISFGTTAANYENPKFGLTASTGSQSPADPFIADFDYVNFDYSPSTPVKAFEDLNTTLKVAETEPAAMTPSIKPVDSNDIGGGKHFTGCEKGESVTYKVEVQEEGDYKLSSRFKATNNNPLAQMSFTVYDAQKELGAFSYIQSTNGEWVTRSTDGFVHLTKGTHELKIVFDTAGIDLNWLKFQMKQDNVDTSVLEAKILEAQQIDLTQYTTAKQKAFNEALDGIRQIVSEPVNSEVVSDAIAALEAAVEELNRTVLPVNIAPKKTQQIDGGIRVKPLDTPWIYAPDGFRFEGGSGAMSWTTVNDTVYLGKIDVTGLEEIRVNFSRGTATTIALKFYLEADDLETPAKRSTSVDGITYDSIYYGGSLQLANELASINFTTKDGYWETYGQCTTAQTALDTQNPYIVSYLGNATNFVDQSKAQGEKNIYLRMENDIVNIESVDLIYAEPVTISSDTYQISEENGTISGIEYGTSAENALSAIHCSSDKAIVGIVDENGNAVDAQTAVRSGMKAQIMLNGNVKGSYELSVLGDLDGANVPNISTLLNVKSYILGRADFTPLQVLSADANQDGRINIFDLLIIKLNILNGIYQ
ncbi:glycoside hydrolase family 3 N-terminal domain-containing protein [Candidatus Soleaferrea massiliensis]|uniref:glycoside hydrolase family 3 N-terminal domain-containing protein n=1 Tax=Candidatus Soleaferrea massiliensis TaxID=1470354 RepID=UPI0018CF88E0|nr:glycoside hydrolase family 3 N-terminal domain-containing protein [Candidatus Soleaferrea massiliensis]